MSVISFTLPKKYLVM